MKNKNIKKQIESTNDSTLELMQLQQKQFEIEMLDKEIEEEKDKDKCFEKLILRHELAKNQTKRLLNHITERYVGYAKSMDEASQAINVAGQLNIELRQLNIELTEALETERKENKQFFDEFYDNLCYCLLTNPRETFEMMLGQVEREHKMKDSSGDSWQWTYKFHFIARLRMAFKIIFG